MYKNNCSLTYDEFYSIAATLSIFAAEHNSKKDYVLFKKVENIARNMCLDDELKVDESGCVIYTHG